MTAWHRLGVADLHAAYRAGAVTPSTVLAAQRARIADIDSDLGTYVDLDLAADASESDARVAAGAQRPLEGVPVAVKSNIAVAGLSWNAGMELRRSIIAQRDAEVVVRLRRAGAIVLGTLNMHEAALGATTDNVWFGRTGNPHRAGTTPGGSSGGSGAAVAAGLCVASLGTDTPGIGADPRCLYRRIWPQNRPSVQFPRTGSCRCRAGSMRSGQLARSLADLEAVWTALSGLRPFAKPTRVLTLEGLGGVTCEPAVLDGYWRAVGLLRDLTPETLTLSLGEIRTAGFVTVARELTRDLGTQRVSRAEQLSDGLHWLLDYADRATLDPSVLPAASAAIRAAIGSDGVLLLPTAPQVAFAHGTRPPANQADFTALASIAGAARAVDPRRARRERLAGRGADRRPGGERSGVVRDRPHAGSRACRLRPTLDFLRRNRCVSSSCST